MRANAFRLLQELFHEDADVLINLMVATPVAVCITDCNGIYQFVNTAYSELYGYDHDELIGAEFTLVLPEREHSNARVMHQNFIKTGADVQQDIGDKISKEWTVIDRFGNSKEVMVEALWLKSRAGRALKATFVVDITERKAIETGLSEKNAQLKYLADHDVLMSILNRRAGLQLLEIELLAAQNQDQKLAIALIDIDHFKHINDAHGHLIGDQVLREIVKLLMDNLRDRDTLIRYGGEELLLVLPEVDEVQAQRIVTRLSEIVCKTPVSVKKLKLTFSAGVTQITKGASVDKLLERSDIALYSAKKNRNTVEIWSELGE